MLGGPSRVATGPAQQPSRVPASALTLKAGYQPESGARGGLVEATASVTITAFAPSAGLAEGWPVG